MVSQDGFFGVMSRSAILTLEDERLEGGEASTPESVSTALSSEPVTEKQKPFPTIGTVTRAPYYRPADAHRHAYLRFEMAEEIADGTHPREVYSTKQNAERLHAQQLAVGDRLRVTGVHHQTEQRDPQGRPLMDANGKPLTKITLYAYGASRVE
jgi:hypothetical protein